ncbi:MAG: cupin domain-containing protein [Patescibacteria group bacterium]|jgi:mannose-6-phosphate isomerase-like protein (cupin superfamily)
MKFTKQNINDIPVEVAHGGSGSRQLLVTPDKLTSPYFEALTKGFLEVGKIFDWHLHQDVDEVFIVLKGQGKFSCNDEVVDYKIGDIITIPANTQHKIEALGSETNEYYFFRIKCK